VQDWIDSNFNNAINVVNLAKSFNFSERNLKRRFSFAAGISVSEYVQEVRVDKAKKLLLATEQTVKDISIAVGYENDSFFSRLFKKKLAQLQQNGVTVICLKAHILDLKHLSNELKHQRQLSMLSLISTSLN